jgi:hypothetical protein
MSIKDFVSSSSSTRLSFGDLGEGQAFRKDKDNQVYVKVGDHACKADYDDETKVYLANGRAPKVQVQPSEVVTPV